MTPQWVQRLFRMLWTLRLMLFSTKWSKPPGIKFPAFPWSQQPGPAEAPPCRTISPGASTSPFLLTTRCSSTSPRSLWWRSTASRPRSRSSRSWRTSLDVSGRLHFSERTHLAILKNVLYFLCCCLEISPLSPRNVINFIIVKYKILYIATTPFFGFTVLYNVYKESKTLTKVADCLNNIEMLLKNNKPDVWWEARGSETSIQGYLMIE